MISYPPLKGTGIPLVSQNRQFQWFKHPTYIYPVVPATAATLLKSNNFYVIWVDCIAERICYKDFLKLIYKENPDLIVFETKTPVVKQYWKIIDELKGFKTVLVGDHVTALPEESMINSNVDFVLTGGDYDFLLLNLCRWLRGDINKLEPGIWYRDAGSIRDTGGFELDHSLDDLPIIDRDLTKWWLYAFENGNYKVTPGSYIMAGRDCWWGRCTFCAWPQLYPKFRVRPVENVLDEIGHLINRYGIKEVMDDTGTFPTGEWLRKFCEGVIRRGYHKKVFLDCNMRFGVLSKDDYRLMKKANFRLLLFGLESANHNTLNRINKRLSVDEIITSCKEARSAGLYPHITIMFGYPWESFEDAQKTYKLGAYLLRKGLAYTLQATIVIPYPGSRLFEEAEQNKWLKYHNWDYYDMKRPVLKTPISDTDIIGFVRKTYRLGFSPTFILRKFLSIRDLADIRYFFRSAYKLTGHIFDFRPSDVI